MITFGTGWVPDDESDHDIPGAMLPGLMGSGALLPASVSLASHVDRVRNQLSSETCVWFSIVRALHMRASIVGRPIPWLSVLHGYWVTLWLSLGQRRPPDIGCQPRVAIEALQSVGVVPEERWPFALERVCEMPPWDVAQHAIDARDTQKYRLSGTAYDAQRALASGYPFVFGTVVDDGVRDGVGIIGRPKGRITGRHMQTAAGYGTTEAGELYFDVVGSYGEDYGDRGFTRISAERLENDCTDQWAVTRPPAPEEIT